MSANIMRGATAVVGVAEQHYKRGEAPHSEKRMTLEVILRACADAGINPREIDGFVSYAGGANDGAIIGGALLIDELRWSNMMWVGAAAASQRPSRMQPLRSPPVKPSVLWSIAR